MFAAFPVTSPKSTTEASPTVSVVSLPAGVITWVGVQFPTGCGGLVHARMLRGAHQVWPVNLDEDISSDGFIVQWRESYDMLQPPHRLRLEVWNDDDTFQHTVTFFFEVSESRPTGGAPAASTLLERLRGLVGGG